MKGCNHCKKSPNACPENNEDIANFPTEPFEGIDVAAWMRFLKDLGISKLFATLPDLRRQSQITYSLQSLALWAFSTCFFRQGSKNAMYTSLQALSSGRRSGLLTLLEMEGNDLPHPSTIDEALSYIPFDKFNSLLLQLFEKMVKRKFFYNHPSLSSGNNFQIGADGYWTHSYSQPHATDAKGNNLCPYCLPRVHNRGKPNEFTTWVHVLVTFVLLCEEFSLPLYVYPLKANQVGPNQSEDRFKEECELIAVHAVLPLLRKKYPKLKFTFLGDALYANRPFIQLCKEIDFDYTIVFKEAPLKTLNKRCDELARTEVYQRSYTHQEVEKTSGTTTQREAAWFNQADAGSGVFTNVLRFEERILDGEGALLSSYKGAWICSKTIFQSNCFKIAKKGRLRWNHEDFHNTCKNRGFDMKHDMARSNPNLLLVWKMMIFIAFFVFEIFRCTTVAKKAQKKRSSMKFAKDLFQQLIDIDWKIIVLSPLLQKPRVQFRFCFSCGP